MGEPAPEHRRNLNPTPAARVAMIIWGREYSQQSGGSMDFWDSLPADRKRRCQLVVKKLAETRGPKT